MMRENFFTKSTDKLRYYEHFLEHLVHFHRKELSSVKNPVLRKTFTIEKEHMDKWYELFEVKNEKTQIPFMYFLKASTSAVLFFDLLAHYHFKFTNIYHVYTSIERYSDFVMQPGNEYTLEVKCASIIKVGVDKASMVLEGRLFDENNNLLLTSQNVFLNVKLTEKEMEQIYDESTGLCEVDCGIPPEKWTRLSAKKPQITLEDADDTHKIFVKDHFGEKYGSLSGDYNPVHTNRVISYIAGHKHPFIQGLAVLNNLIKVIAEKKTSWHDIHLTFCNKTLEGHELLILRKGNNIELLEEGHLVAFGTVVCLQTLE